MRYKLICSRYHSERWGVHGYSYREEIKVSEFDNEIEAFKAKKKLDNAQKKLNDKRYPENVRGIVEMGFKVLWGDKFFIKLGEPE